MRQVILASASPRRKALLAQIGLRFSVKVSRYEEFLDSTLSPHMLARKLSLGKAQDVAAHQKDAIVIAADTVIVCKGKLMGKPASERDAQKMLALLSGRPHVVITGFTVIDSKSSKTITQSVETKVYMKKLTKKEIDTYIATKEPFDKAGGYGIQELGALLIEKIVGDYANVVGLPLVAVAKALKKMDPTLFPF